MQDTRWYAGHQGVLKNYKDVLGQPGFFVIVKLRKNPEVRPKREKGDIKRAYPITIQNFVIKITSIIYRTYISILNNGMIFKL